MRDRYATPGALDAAIRAKAKQAASSTGMSPGQLVTAFMFQRLLARVFLDEGWMLKGGQSLLVRYPLLARLSRDADLFRPDAEDLGEAVEAFGKAVSRDLDDYFRFAPESVAYGEGSAKVKVSVHIGTARKQSLDVDLVVRRTPTGAPTRATLEPAIPLDWPDVWPNVILYPLVDHLGDKLCAIWERHLRIGREPAASTRYRDLGDALLMSQRSQFDGRAVQRALASEVVRRNELGGVELVLPPTFEVPDVAMWTRDYPKALSGRVNCVRCPVLAMLSGSSNAAGAQPQLRCFDGVASLEVTLCGRPSVHRSEPAASTALGKRPRKAQYCRSIGSEMRYPVR